MGADCILSKLWMTSPSLFTNTRSVVEAPPYPCLINLIIYTDLGSKLRIAQSQTLLPSGSAINRDPLDFFRNQSGSEGSKGFPATRTLASKRD